jgi:hypothetical protein
MNKFEEFESEMGPAVDGIIPGAVCAKISVTFIDQDNTTCTIDFTREGYAERLALAAEETADVEDDQLYSEEE